MNSFDQIYNGNTFRFTLNKIGSFPRLKIEILADNYCYYRSREIIISKYVIEEIIELLKNGNPNLDVSRFEFRDPDRSFIIFINGETTVIGQTYNLISGQREEFAINQINKIEFLNYLERANV